MPQSRRSKVSQRMHLRATGEAQRRSAHSQLVHELATFRRSALFSMLEIPESVAVIETIEEPPQIMGGVPCPDLSFVYLDADRWSLLMTEIKTGQNPETIKSLDQQLVALRELVTQKEWTKLVYSLGKKVPEQVLESAKISIAGIYGTHSSFRLYRHEQLVY